MTLRRIIFNILTFSTMALNVNCAHQVGIKQNDNKQSDNDQNEAQRNKTVELTQAE
jgi:hypothetical protein